MGVIFFQQICFYFLGKPIFIVFLLIISSCCSAQHHESAFFVAAVPESKGINTKEINHQQPHHMNSVFALKNLKTKNDSHSTIPSSSFRNGKSFEQEDYHPPNSTHTNIGSRKLQNSNSIWKIFTIETSISDWQPSSSTVAVLLSSSLVFSLLVILVLLKKLIQWNKGSHTSRHRYEEVEGIPFSVGEKVNPAVQRASKDGYFFQTNPELDEPSTPILCI
mmetsp:Transcript_34190/g.45197  ORF Transcript_34190/g.45197 Transcript_34190/m.45197 type:complete len:220 (+) Transcript_34190:21-680(+)